MGTQTDSVRPRPLGSRGGGRAGPRRRLEPAANRAAGLSTGRAMPRGIRRNGRRRRPSRSVARARRGLQPPRAIGSTATSGPATGGLITAPNGIPPSIARRGRRPTQQGCRRGVHGRARRHRLRLVWRCVLPSDHPVTYATRFPALSTRNRFHPSSRWRRATPRAPSRLARVRHLSTRGEVATRMNLHRALRTRVPPGTSRPGAATFSLHGKRSRARRGRRLRSFPISALARGDPVSGRAARSRLSPCARTMSWRTVWPLRR